MSKFERITQFLPAYDKRDPDPSKSYGIHGVELRMVLKGPKGAVQFVLFTNWQLPHITKEQENKLCALIYSSQLAHVVDKANKTKKSVEPETPEPIKRLIREINAIEAHSKETDDEISLQLRCFWMPSPADLGYHSYVPLHEGQVPIGAVKYDYKQMELVEGTSFSLPKRTETGTFSPCEYLDGAPCYYDGSGLNADRIYKVLLEQGSDGVWKELEEYYEHTFKDVAEPVVGEGIRSSSSG